MKIHCIGPTDRLPIRQYNPQWTEPLFWTGGPGDAPRVATRELPLERVTFGLSTADIGYDPELDTLFIREVKNHGYLRAVEDSYLENVKRLERSNKRVLFYAKLLTSGDARLRRKARREFKRVFAK